jgi:hypothetical protein
MGSDLRLYNESLIVALSSTQSAEPREWEYNGVQHREWELSQSSVGNNHGKLVVKDELEADLWSLSVWLEDLVTVSALIPLPGYD